MSDKLNLRRLQAGYRSVNALNDDFDRIEAAIDNTLSRDGSGPNQMESELDMNSYRVINIGDPSGPNDAVRLKDVTDLVEDIASLVLPTKADKDFGNVEPDTGRDALGLGDSATLDVGTTVDTVAAGDDPRIVNAIQPTSLDAYLASVTAPSKIGFKHSSSNYTTNLGVAVDKTGNVRLFGAIGDNVSRPLSSVTSFGILNTSGWTLSQWQAVFPHATALTDQLDWCGIQAAINWRNTTGGDVYLPSGGYRINKTLEITGHSVRLVGDGAATAIRPISGTYDTIWFHHPSGDSNLLSNNGLAFLQVDDLNKTGGLSLKVEQVQRFLMNDADINITGGSHFRAFNNVSLTRVRSWFPNRAVNHILLSGGESGTGRESDVFTMRDCSMSGSNGSSGAPTNSDRHGLVVDGFVTTVLCDKVYQIGVEGYANWVRNTVGATLAPRHIHFRGNEVEWPSLDAIRVQAGSWIRITECDLAGAWAARGVTMNTGVRHALIANNDIRDCGHEGIGSDATHVQILGNRIYANSRPSRGGEAGVRDGVYLYSSSRLTVIENNIFGDDGVGGYQRYGVGVGAGADQHIIRNNIGIHNASGVLSSPYAASSTKFYGDNMGTSNIGTG